MSNLVGYRLLTDDGRLHTHATATMSRCSQFISTGSAEHVDKQVAIHSGKLCSTCFPRVTAEFNSVPAPLVQAVHALTIAVRELTVALQVSSMGGKGAS